MNRRQEERNCARTNCRSAKEENKRSAVKKILIMLMTIMPLAAMASDDKPISYEELPAAAKTFIQQNFPDAKVALATVESQSWNPTYDVIFTDGTKLEFIASGQWKDIDCKYSRVPDSVIPEKIRAFIAQHNPENYVKEIERDRNNYEVKLDNGLEVRFDINGEFRGYDD